MSVRMYFNPISFLRRQTNFNKKFFKNSPPSLAVVQGDTPEEIYKKAKEVIDEQSGSTIWIPVKDQL